MIQASLFSHLVKIKSSIVDLEKIVENNRKFQSFSIIDGFNYPCLSFPVNIEKKKFRKKPSVNPPKEVKGTAK